MRNFKMKWLSSLLSVLLVFSMFVSGIQVSAYAAQSEETQQAMNQADSEAEQAAEKAEESADDTKSKFSEEEGIAAVSVSPEDAEESAVITKPKDLKLDGSKSYVIFTSCVWGGHTYGIGPDAAATDRLGISRNDCKAGETIYLAKKGLGWKLTQTEKGLIIQSGGGQYLTVSDDQTKLVISETEKVSGLTISDNGTLALAKAGTETVYLQKSDSVPEPQKGNAFKISEEGEAAVFYFAEIEEKDDPEKPDKPDEPKPSEEVLFPSLLPQTNFRAEVVSPDKVYGDDQYVIFTKKGDQYVAITSGADCSSPLSLDKAAAAGARLSSPDQNVLWTVNNNRSKAAPESGYYKYIRSCASNMYLAAKDGLLDENINDDFYLADKDGSSALLATSNGRYVTLQGDKYSVTSDKNSASRFYFAKLLQKEQQSSGGKTVIPEGTLLRLVDWNSIEDGKTYAIINANEFNSYHYALSGSGRLTRYSAQKLTDNTPCPSENLKGSGVHGAAPCEAKAGDFFYSTGENLFWTVSLKENHKATFLNKGTGLYLNLSDGPAASQTPSVSKEPADITYELVQKQTYASYLKEDSGKYLGLWQYIASSVSKDADECCAYYLAEVFDTEDTKNLPVTKVEKDDDPSTVSFGGIYSIYQGSQHLLTGGIGVDSFLMMDDGKGGFKPSDSKYTPGIDDNYAVTYCADYESDMPIFTKPGKYTAVNLDDSDRFTDEQKSALKAIIANSYPYVSEKQFLANMKDAGYDVSENCGSDEILAGIQAAIYTVTNPREDGKQWGYESSEGWAHGSYEVNKPNSYVSDPTQAESDVNNVRDYLWSLTSPMKTMDDATSHEDEPKPEIPESFAITTEVNGHTFALTVDSNYSYQVMLQKYDPNDIRQMWYKDEHGSLQWLPMYFRNGNKVPTSIPCLQFVIYDDRESVYIDAAREYGAANSDGTLRGSVPLKLNADGTLSLNDYEDKIGNLREKVNDSLTVTVDSSAWDYASQYHKYNELMDIKDFGVVHKAQGQPLTFSTMPAEPNYPEFVEYDIASNNYKITYNDNGTYNVDINGSLNLPIRAQNDKVAVSVWCNDTMLGYLNMDSDSKEFSFSAKNIPDTEEAHFWLAIEETDLIINVFEPENPGWQAQVGGFFGEAYKEFHEETTSIPVEKVWSDGAEAHSKDSVEVGLMEGNKETSYKVTLNAGNNWKGAFKHVPYKSWTYSAYGYWADPAEKEQYKVPLGARTYSVKELSGPAGYIPSYGGEVVNDGTVNLNGKAQPVQVVCQPEGTDKLYALTMDYATGDMFTEYVPGEESQMHYLNGCGTLNLSLCGVYYYNIKCEHADEQGKHYLCMEYDGEKRYLAADGRGYTENKDEALVVGLYLWDGHQSTLLTSLPEGTFQPVKAALEVCENGEGTGYVMTTENGEPPLVEYNPMDLYQKFHIYRYNDQLWVWTGDTYGVALIPCDGDTDEYMLGMSYTDPATGETHTIYSGWDKENGRITQVENQEDALHLRLKDAVHMECGENVNAFDGTLTVTNTPGASLEVSKTVSGEGADQNEAFTFTVTLNDKTIKGTYGDMEFVDGVATFDLKHGEKKTAIGLPPGTKYEVTESNKDGYTVTVNGTSLTDGKASGTLVKGELAKLAFNNDRPKQPVIIGPSTTSVTAKKVWKLDDGGKAADSVKVALLKNGTEEKTVTLSEENNWTYTWTGLAIGDTWTVKELDVPEGFDSTIQQSGTNFTITNDDKPNEPTKPDDPNKPDDPEKPDKPTKPEKPEKPTKPSKPAKPADPNHSMVPDDGMIDGGKGGSSGSGTPQTGDTANAAPWLAVMGLSAAGLSALFFVRRKKSERNAE